MVSSLTLYPDTTVMNNDAITQLYVAYKFLNCDPAELETPVSLPKPAPNRPIHYNFKKGERFLHELSRTSKFINKAQIREIHKYWYI
jgi:hypothetical protein